MSRIDDLQKSLYSRKEQPVSNNARSELTRNEKEVVGDWDDTDIKTSEHKEGHSSKGGLFLKIFFFGAMAFFVVAVLVAIYVFYGGFGVVSSKNVDIRILGPVSIAGGEELGLDITVLNQNTIDLEQAELFIEYPQGTRNAGDVYQEMTRVRESLGPIPAGGIVRKTYKSVLFGQQDELKNIKVTVEYRVKNSNAIFAKDKMYDISISSAPLTLTVEYPSEVQSSQDFEFKLLLTSNARTDLDNLILRAEYPFGFTMSASDPKSSIDDNIWNIGTIKPEERKSIIIRGRLQSQENEERSFRFNAGVRSKDNEKSIQTEFVSDIKTITVRRPGLAVTTKINGSSNSEYVTSSGREINVEIDWFNTLPTSIRDAKVEVAFNGAVNRNSVNTNDGFFRSVDNTIVWDPQRNTALEELAPGQKGTFRFRFTPQTSSSDRSPEINFTVTMSGTRFSGQNIPEQVLSNLSRKITLQTDFNLLSRLAYVDGPFTNSGPIPPKADTTTTYTVLWTVNNSFNDIAKGQIKARLPLYVTWMGVTNPDSETVYYNSTTREVIWDIGNINAGTGFAIPARNVAFQISFTPSLSQVSSSPVLLEQHTFVGQDRFTGTEISKVVIPLTTSLRQDTGYRQGMDNVVR